jgi:FkbM family methyltransferase
MLPSMRHHPAFDALTVHQPAETPALWFDWLRVLQRKAYDAGTTGCDVPALEDREAAARPDQPIVSGEARGRCLPAFDEEYLEWVDIVESVRAARGCYTMIELGAGFGRWLVRAVAVLRQLAPDLPFALVAVEAEPTHMLFLREHFELNGIDPDDHWLIEAAVAARTGYAKFAVGRATSWYGQAIVGAASRFDRMKRLWRKSPAGADVDVVKTVDLRTILDRFERVDLIDLDVQGQELEVLSAAADELDRKVARLHIGTHATAIEAGLRELLAQRGWEPVNDYACGKESQTPFGRIAFGDGVQTWANPRCA